MGHKCILCGAELPNKRGGRCYCKECAAYMRAERLREKNESIRTIKIDPDPAPVKREVTLKTADMNYCRPCIHHGNFDHYVLCEYMFQTGHRRGCKPGVGCEKRETVAKKKTDGTGDRECDRCGKHFEGGPKSHLCPECRYEMRRARALQMVEARRK